MECLLNPQSQPAYDTKTLFQDESDGTLEQTSDTHTTEMKDLEEKKLTG
jgi:hypothetical protein